MTMINNVVILIVSASIAAQQCFAFVPPSPILTATTSSNHGLNIVDRHPDLKLLLSSRAIDDGIVIPVSPSSVTKTSDEEATKEISDSLSSVITPPPSFTPLQQTLRAIPPLTLISYILNPQLFDDGVSQLWNAIYQFEPSHYPLFEASIAVIGFFWSIFFFCHLHLLLGPERTTRYRLDGSIPPNHAAQWIRGKEIHIWFNPIASYMGSIYLYQQLFHTYRDIPVMAPTFGVLVIEVIFGVVLYDLTFYPLHYLMHNAPWGPFRRIHGYHHRLTNTALNSVETVQHSYLDGFLQVAVNVAVQHVSPFGGAKHALSRIIHNLLVTYLLAEGHSGYDFGWMSHRVWPEVMGGVERHDKHHHDGRMYYHQFFKYLDDFFGFTEDGIKEKRQLEKDRR